MNTHDIELPAEFRSGNDIPVTQATIKRERMEEILRVAIEPYAKRIAELEAKTQGLLGALRDLKTELILSDVEQEYIESHFRPCLNKAAAAIAKATGDRLGQIAAEAQIEADHKRRGEPVAYLDLGVGGYIDVGSDLTDEELAALPKGRHMLAIIGTYGVDGYKEGDPQIPEGWQLVPKKPTEEMKKASLSAFDGKAYPTDMRIGHMAMNADVYKAMLAAAPKPEDTK